MGFFEGRVWRRLAWSSASLQLSGAGIQAKNSKQQPTQRTCTCLPAPPRIHRSHLLHQHKQTTSATAYLLKNRPARLRRPLPHLRSPAQRPSRSHTLHLPLAAPPTASASHPSTSHTMADVATAPNPSQQVPLDTIPISPVDGNGSSEGQDKSASANTDDGARTVFHDPENFNVKHPLMNTWTLWFTKPPSGKVRGGSVRNAGL